MRKKRVSPPLNSKVLPILYMIIGAVLHSSFRYMAQQKSPSLLALSSQRRERLPGNAWVLQVTLTFTSEEDQMKILEEWRPATKYCADREPFLWHYEAGRSDSNPLQIRMVERYESKELYLKKHKTGEEFLKFRPKLKALQDAGRVEVEGFSFQELGYGFT